MRGCHSSRLRQRRCASATQVGAVCVRESTGGSACVRAYARVWVTVMGGSVRYLIALRKTCSSLTIGQYKHLHYTV